MKTVHWPHIALAANHPPLSQCISAYCRVGVCPAGTLLKTFYTEASNLGTPSRRIIMFLHAVHLLPTDAVACHVSFAHVTCSLRRNIAEVNAHVDVRLGLYMYVHE